MRKICLLITALLLSTSIFLSCAEAAARANEQRYDVVIVGAGSGGCAAAIQAARMGMYVALIEQSDWVGGQMTGAAVCTMDDITFTRTGIYREFITKIRKLYEGWDRNVNVCYWGGDTIAFEPWAGQKVLLEMLKETSRINIILKARPISAKVEKNCVTSAVFEGEGGRFTVKAKIFIDATECGDFIPLTGARYRSGNGISPKINNSGVIQDITYPAVVKKFEPGTMPEELRVKQEPKGYSNYLFHFRATIRKDGSTWPGDYPFSVPVHNEYRAIPDPSNQMNIKGDDPSSWPNITKTAINWANDYPGGNRANGTDTPGLSVRFLEDKKYRAEVERAAMLKTLCFIYYMQNELGMEDWSVDDRQGYGGWFSNNWQSSPELAQYSDILKHFPPFPYVRESRRLVGVKTMVIDDALRDETLKRTVKSKPDSIALGEYPIDIHGALNSENLDKGLNESAIKLPESWGGAGLFQIPFGALIPEKVDGLLAAEKNISVSRIVNGATRLQPVTMLTGQAAGATAALAVKNKTQPRNLRAIDVQTVLFAAKDKLSLYNFTDVPDYATVWPGVEAAMMYGYMDPRTETEFGIDEEMHWVDVRAALRRALGVKEFPKREIQGPVTHGEFGEWLKLFFDKDLKRYAKVIESQAGDEPLTKGQLAVAVFEILKAEPAPKKK